MVSYLKLCGVLSDIKKISRMHWSKYSEKEKQDIYFSLFDVLIKEIDAEAKLQREKTSKESNKPHILR